MYSDATFVPAKTTMTGTITELFPDLVGQTPARRVPVLHDALAPSLLGAQMHELARPDTLTERESARISKTITVVRRVLKIVLRNDARALQLFGSHVRHTRLSPTQDGRASIDALVPFRTSTTTTPAQSVALLQDLIGTWLTDEASRPTRTGVSIDLLGRTLRLVPGLLTRDGHLSMIGGTDGQGLSWLPIDPLGAAERLRSADASTGGLVSPVVRIAKAWNVYAGRPFGGYELEQIVARHRFKTSRQVTFMALDALASLPVPRTLDGRGHAMMADMKQAAELAMKLERARRFEQAYEVMRPHLPHHHDADRPRLPLPQS